MESTVWFGNKKKIFKRKKNGIEMMQAKKGQTINADDNKIGKRTGKRQITEREKSQKQIFAVVSDSVVLLMWFGCSYKENNCLLLSFSMNF